MGGVAGGATVVDSTTTGAVVGARLGAGAAAGVGLAVAAGVVATAGAIQGGVMGAEVAEKADDPDEAAKKSLDSVTARAMKTITDTWEFTQKLFQPGGPHNQTHHQL